MSFVHRAALAPLFLLSIMAGSGALHAQTLDYAAFEQLFGEPVTSSVTGKPQRVSEAPAEIEIVTASQIRHSGATSIPDILRFVAGIDVRSYGQQDAAVGIRGYNTALNPRVLVLLDGQQVYEDDYGLTVWSMIPVALGAIRQIEIIKGPNAALYGFNAVSGVINIVTYDPLRDPVDEADVRGGSQSTAYGEAVATAQRKGAWGVRLSAKAERSMEYDGTEASAQREQPRSATLSVDGRFQVAPRVEWDLSGSIASLDSNYFIDTGSYSPASFRSNSARTRLGYDSQLGLLQLDAYRNENRSADTLPSQYSQWREDVTVVNLRDLVKLGGSHTVRLAAEYRDNDVASLQTFQGHVGYQIVAGSAMWGWDALPNLTLTNAVRLDSLSFSHKGAQFIVPTIGPLFSEAHIVQPSFNSGAVLTVDAQDTIRLSVARALQIPSLVDFGIASDYPAAVLAGNPQLSPSAVMNYELDYDRVLPRWSSTLRLAAFAQHTQGSIGSSFGSGYAFLPTGQLLLMARNFGNSDEAGGELTLKGKSASGLRWTLGYALAAVHDRSDDQALQLASSVGYQRQTPTHSVVARLGYDWRRLELDAELRWQSHYQDYVADPSTLSIHQQTVSNYVTMNARIGYQLTRAIALSLTAEQLGQQDTVETAGLQVERRFLAGVRSTF